MTVVAQRIKGFLRSPQGRSLMDRVRREARKPSARQKLRQLMQRARGGSDRRR
ncbi:hypothetical protein [Plantactinospora sp. CA-290183]|uniref:hypothetical protein n=1 Tax=Plantactinospora sp. CA-290183 TaxID=3240006 RepID=UPI003D91254F